MPLIISSDFETPVVISSNARAVSAAIFVPAPTFTIESSISSAVSAAADADFAARFLTSSATTANPYPASPALAASTAAFKAKIFVWNAISSITLIIF